MMRPGWPGDGAPSLESLRELRLRALLNDLVHDLGPVKAAEQLGIDRKTLWRSEGAGEMSPRLIKALERLLLERTGSGSGRWRSGLACWSGSWRRVMEEAATVATWGAQWATRCGRSSPGRCSGWSGGWTGWKRHGARRRSLRQSVHGRDRRGPSGVTPTWLRGSPPMTMSRCTARPGS